MQLYVSHLLQVVISVEALKTGKKGNTYQVITDFSLFYICLYIGAFIFLSVHGFCT